MAYDSTCVWNILSVKIQTMEELGYLSAKIPTCKLLGGYCWISALANHRLNAWLPSCAVSLSTIRPTDPGSLQQMQKKRKKILLNATNAN